MSSKGPRRAASSVDVAERAGVSQATVSRVLSGKDRVAEPTRAKVLKALDELGYEPNLNARALKTRRTRTIAVVIADITNPFYPELVEALSEALSARDQMMLLWNDASSGADESDESVVAAMLQGRVDGAIFATATDDSATLARAGELDLPIALINRRVDTSAFDSVTSDNDAGGRSVAEYFAAHGRRPAVIAGPQNASTSRERSAAFIDQWAADHDGDQPLVHYRDFSYDSGAAFCEELLGMADAPDAIFATNDYTAFGVLDQARRMGVSVPDDLWVVGYDDIAMAGWDTFGLTTVRQPTPEMATEAVRLLLDRIESPEVAVQSLRFPSELVVRRSTGHAPVS